MQLTIKISAVVLSALVTASALHAQELYIYPSKGQSAEQQEKDKFECYNWAKNDTGFDPMEVPKATEPAPTTQKRSGGLLRGALGGAAIGAIAGDSDDAKKGAAIGGLLGGARQSSRNRQVEQERAQWEQDQSAQYAQRRNNYNRAYSACLEGRGYTVK